MLLARGRYHAFYGIPRSIFGTTVFGNKHVLSFVSTKLVVNVTLHQKLCVTCICVHNSQGQSIIIDAARSHHIATQDTRHSAIRSVIKKKNSKIMMI